MPSLTLRALVLAPLLLTACGARSSLRGEWNEPWDAGDVADVVGMDTPPPPRDVPPPPRDVPPPPRDVTSTVEVVCPAPVFARQTDTVTVAATARSNLGLPLRHAWTVERAPMGSRSRPIPADAPSMRFTFDTGGDWVFRFTATDPNGVSDSCTVRARAEPAIELLCPNDQSNYQGATVRLEAQARSNLGRAVTVRWAVESRPPASRTAPTPDTGLVSSLQLDQLGDWQLRLTATDSGGLTQSCVTRVHADPDVIVTCPPDTVSRPFATITLAGTARSRLGLPLSYRWEIVEQPITSTATLGRPDAISTPFTFDVAGNWTYRFTATNSRGNAAYCTTRARSASSEAVRVEIVWNVDRSCRSCNPRGGGIDIDLHLADAARATGRWASSAPGDSDCYYANCRCGSPGMPCMMETLDWPPVGSRVNNPQLDIDHISDLPGPENINIFSAATGSEFDVGVHYFSGSEPTPVVARVYCGGAVVFESEPVRLSGRGSPMGNDMWLVGRITVTPGGCTFARCGRPGDLGMCIRPQNAR